MLRVRDLTVHRAGRLVLDSLTFELPDGAALAVLGPNGAGKTTLLEALAGLVPVTSGSIELDGRNVTRLPAHRRARAGLRLIGEGRRVIPQVTVADNLDLARLGGARASTESVLELFPKLKARWRTLAGQLSGGEQQMLALAMGLLAEPRVLLLDEPSFGLAPQIVDELFGTLKDLQGITLVLAEQHVQRALGLCAHVLVLRSGRALFDSSTGGTSLEEVVEGYLGRGDEAVAVPSQAEVTDLVSVRLPVTLKRRLQLEARRRGADPNDLVGEAVRRLVGRR
jgi:branched-chain amino acid transport system ATP-binding protein